ncbi:hypothetical protein [uncultured Gemella sp.]|uniref:hypothetical protein n=1 Tax=uncultured Gemella sp. TaxID=254352 RepID=UPI0028D7022E|nr:hypothetical protein [uncultured Gemella sp.]
MVKYLVNADFTDKNTYERVKKGTELDITEVRAKEIISTLGEGALTIIPEEVKEEVKEEAPAVEDKKAKEVE